MWGSLRDKLRDNARERPLLKGGMRRRRLRKLGDWTVAGSHRRTALRSEKELVPVRY